MIMSYRTAHILTNYKLKFHILRYSVLPTEEINKRVELKYSYDVKNKSISSGVYNIMNWDRYDLKTFDCLRKKKPCG